MKQRWQYSLGGLFAIMTMVAVATAILVQGNSWWMMAWLVMAQAVIFCIIAGMGEIDEQPNQSKRSQQSKEFTE